MGRELAVLSCIHAGAPILVQGKVQARFRFWGLKGALDFVVPDHLFLSIASFFEVQVVMVDAEVLPDLMHLALILC